MLEKLSSRLTEVHITLGLKTATVLLATIVLFIQDLTIIFNDALQSEITSYLLAIPLLLIYHKRKMLRAVIPLEDKDQPKETSI